MIGKKKSKQVVDDLKPTVSKQIVLSMDAGWNLPATVGDVRQWLADVDMMGVPDSTELGVDCYLELTIQNA